MKAHLVGFVPSHFSHGRRIPEYYKMLSPEGSLFICTDEKDALEVCKERGWTPVKEISHARTNFKE